MRLLRQAFSGLRLRGNIYWALVQYLLISMALFSLCRLGFYVFNRDFFPRMDVANFLYVMLVGLKFDFAGVLYINAILVLLMAFPLKIRFHAGYLGAVKWLFIVTNALALAMNVADFIYFQFTLRRTTADVFRQFQSEQNLGILFGRFLIDYWYATLVWCVLLAILIIFSRTVRVEGPMTADRKTFYISSLVAMALTVCVFIVGVRGGISDDRRPLNLTDAGEYVKDPTDISLVLNTPFSLLRTVGKPQLKQVNYFASDTEIDQVFTPVRHAPDSGAFTYENVMVIIMESFSKEFFGSFNPHLEGGNYKGYTPFLDSLIQHSKTFQFSFANGRISVDALPSVISSLPYMGLHYIRSPFSGNKINSLASLLKDKGYYSAFFHGAGNGSMGFGPFMIMAGFDAYYGMDEYDREVGFDGWWGIWDHHFLSFAAEKMNNFKEPFVSVFFSLSSHHPFRVPAEFENKFKGGPIPLQRCIQYADYSLKKFFEEASRMPWYNNTLFVITADHTSLSQFQEYKTDWGLYSVPIIFYKPDNSLKGVESQIVEHVDIMPTILDYLNYDKDYVSFGRSAFDTSIEPYAFQYKDNAYQLIQGDYLLIFNGEKSVALYDFKNDRMQENNLLGERNDIVARMETKIKAIVQQYNNRMIGNDLVVDKTGVSFAGRRQAQTP